MPPVARIVLLPEKEFQCFALKPQLPHLFPTVVSYENWRENLKPLRIFWSTPWKSTQYLGIQVNNRLVAAARLHTLSFSERGLWGSNIDQRGEVQDIYLAIPTLETMQQLMEACSSYFSQQGIHQFGFSTWNPKYWNLLEKAGLSPYARSIVMYWSPRQPLAKKPNPNISLKIYQKPISRFILTTLRKIQKSSWGFYIPPEPDKQCIIIAWLDEQPVGSVYFNKVTGNLDYGVHVIRQRWRQHIGTALLESARQLCLQENIPQLTVIRVLRALSKWNNFDRQAICFYRETGGKLLWEIRGYRLKKRKRQFDIPQLQDLKC